MTMTDVTAPPRPARTTTDIGLLVLRIGVGAAMLQAGLRKAFDFTTTATFMDQGGWRLPGFAAFMVTAAETLGDLGLAQRHQPDPCHRTGQLNSYRPVGAEPTWQ